MSSIENLQWLGKRLSLAQPSYFPGSIVLILWWTIKVLHHRGHSGMNGTHIQQSSDQSFHFLLFQAFQDISTYFSDEEWGKLTQWQKSAYVYMKRNYIRMTDLGKMKSGFRPVWWFPVCLLCHIFSTCIQQGPLSQYLSFLRNVKVLVEPAAALFKPLQS